MPTVRTELTIPDVNVEAVWEVVAAFDRYPETMPSVLSVKFHERSTTEAISEWSVLLNDSELNWIERDAFQRPDSIRFDSIEGDLEIFRGHWQLEEADGGVRVEFLVEFDLGIPSLSAVLDPVGVDALKENSMSMLTAIRDKLQ